MMYTSEEEAKRMLKNVMRHWSQPYLTSGYNHICIQLDSFDIPGGNEFIVVNYNPEAGRIIFSLRLCSEAYIMEVAKDRVQEQGPFLEVDPKVYGMMYALEHLQTCAMRYLERNLPQTAQEYDLPTSQVAYRWDGRPISDLTIHDLGKFEGQHRMIPHLWEMVMNGDGESEFDGNGVEYSGLVLDDEDRKHFLTSAYGVWLWESNDGFVNSYIADTENDFDDFAADIGENTED